MTQILIAWALALGGTFLIERMTRPASPFLASSPGRLALRIVVTTFIFTFFIVASWRPFYSAFGTCVLVGVFVAISNGKLAYTYEPLVFSDLAFIRDIFRHATLFHTTWLGPALLLGVTAVIGLTTTIWFAREPPIDVGGALAVSIAAAWLVLALLPVVSPSIRSIVAALLLRIKSEPEVFRDIRETGLMATLVADALTWLGEDRTERIARWSPPLKRPGPRSCAAPADLIVAVQCESFLDLRRLGSRTLELPCLDAARARAISWGKLGSAFAGGYTMRSEIAFLTGRPSRDLGFDRYYPYLNAGAYRAAAIPASLAESGYETVFIHPFDREFFQRHRAIPALGFADMILLEDFEGAERIGPYISDSAVGERILHEARTRRGPAFLFAATMENHEPWVAGRFDGIDDPVDIYLRHVVNADALLGSLIRELEAWPGRVVLAFWGDHVPLLKAFADPFPDSDTDYVLLELGRDARHLGPATERRLEVHELTWALLHAAGLHAATREG